MLVDAFKQYIFPYMVQLGVIFFVWSVAHSAYSLFRQPNWQQFLDKVKAAVFAYAVVKGAFVIVGFVDKVLGKMQ